MDEVGRGELEFPLPACFESHHSHAAVLQYGPYTNCCILLLWALCSLLEVKWGNIKILNSAHHYTFFSQVKPNNSKTGLLLQAKQIYSSEAWTNAMQVPYSKIKDCKHHLPQVLQF